MQHRSRRARAVLATVLLSGLLTACASDPALYPHGAQSGSFTDSAQSPDGSGLQTVLILVLIPLALLLLIAAAVWLPGVVKGNRYRPQYGWSAEPVWFAGPPDPLPAVEQAQTGDVARGGAGGSW